ncbi:MAG: 2-succinyl-6-hydroxy-2,4-cyclohexadiene-1-carboxylate synthase [Cyanobacteria bacterium J06649_4]
MPFLRTAHHTLHYITEGHSAQPSVLLLHGFLGSHQDFAPLLAKLSCHFHCIVPDLPGHGQTQTDVDGYTFEKTANTLLALLDYLQISKTHLLGYSMGGRLSLYLACEFPERFERLVLESASPGLKTAEERADRRVWEGAIAYRLQTTPLATFLEQWYRNPLFASLHRYPETYAAMLHRRKQNNPTELVNALRGLGTGQQASLWTALENIEQALLLMVGALDTKFVKINREMIAMTRNSCHAQLKVIEDTGHNLQLESPTVYARTILIFLNDTLLAH